MKKLTKSKNKNWSGVLAGFAEYFEIDPTLFRIVFVFVTIITGVIPMVIFYIIAAVIMPNAEPHKHTKHHNRDKDVKDTTYTEEKPESNTNTKEKDTTDTAA